MYRERDQSISSVGTLLALIRRPALAAVAGIALVAGIAGVDGRAVPTGRAFIDHRVIRLLCACPALVHDILGVDLSSGVLVVRDRFVHLVAIVGGDGFVVVHPAHAGLVLRMRPLVV